MKILIRNGHVVDPSQGIDGRYDILVENRKIARVQKQGASPKLTVSKKDRTIDARGLFVLPGLVDMHVHLREPGYEHKETIATGTKAAVRGGFTSVCAMPNTSPVNDNAGITEYILQKAHKEGVCSVFPVGAVTKGQRGEELSEMGLMKEAGCVAFSDDGHPIANSVVMRRALEYSRSFEAPIISHSEDPLLSGGGVMNEGTLSHRMGLKGIPKAAEEIAVYRDIALAELTGGRLHIAHVSTEGSVRIIREAKKRGVAVTCETCPHYFSVTEEAVRDFNTHAKVNPPLRTKRDMEAVKKGLADGTIDVIATDHAPHHQNEKLREFDMAPPGISGLETALPLSLTLLRDGVLSMSELVEKMTVTPARILGLPKGTVEEGADADILLLDTDAGFTVEAERFFSKGKNTPFDGWELRGMAAATISSGKVHEWR
jgi:dihydroorotase